MATWPENWDLADLSIVRESQPTGQSIFISPTSHRERYHTDHECPHVSSGFYVIAPDDTRHKHYREKLKKCMWCRYDSNDVLDLG